MSSTVFSVPRQSLSHRFLSRSERRPLKVEQFSRKTSFVGPSIKVKGAQSRSNWNTLNGVTVRKKKNSTNPAQKMEDKENAGKQPVQVNPVERNMSAVLQSIQSPNLCTASVISKDFEKIRLEEEKSPILENHTASVSLSHSVVKSLADKHSVADTGNSAIQMAKKTMPGLEKFSSDAKLTKKPIRGVFRGKVVQSKINSFWKVSDDDSLEIQAKAAILSNDLPNSQPSNNLTDSQGNIAHFKIKSSIKVSNKPLDKAHSAGVSKRPAKLSASKVKLTKKIQSSVTARTTSVSSSVQLSSTAFSAHRTATRPNSCSVLDQKTKHARAAELPRGKMHPSGSFNVCKDLENKEKPLSTAATVGKNSRRPPLKHGPLTDRADVSCARPSQTSKTAPFASSRTISAPFRTKSVPEIFTAVSTRFVDPKESAEERRARLAQWQASKGKVMKRPPMVKMKVLPSDVHKETIKFLPESVKDDMPRLSKEEADEKDSECTQPNQTIDVLQNIHLNQNVGSPKYETVEIVKEQNNNGELEENVEQLVKNEGLVDHETKTEVNTTLEIPKTENESSKKKLNLRQAYKKAEDDKDGEVQFITSSQFMSPVNESEGSSVIRFNVRTTPSLKSLSSNMHRQLGDCTFKDFKFLTPVRRSLRIERQSFRLPEMLHDHDPCLSSLGELPELDGDVNAYIFRENNALKDLAKNANQLKEK